MPCGAARHHHRHISEDDSARATRNQASQFGVPVSGRAQGHVGRVLLADTHGAGLGQVGDAPFMHGMPSGFYPHRPLLIQIRADCGEAISLIWMIGFPPKASADRSTVALAVRLSPISAQASTFRFAQPPPESAGSQHNGITRGRPLE